jgi:hypothetical protein
MHWPLVAAAALAIGFYKVGALSAPPHLWRQRDASPWIRVALPARNCRSGPGSTALSVSTNRQRVRGRR